MGPKAKPSNATKAGNVRPKLTSYSSYDVLHSHVLV